MEVIGVVGAAGDLGSKMTVQACSVFEDVRTFDVSPNVGSAQTGIDPALQASSVTTKPQAMKSLAEIIDTCGIIHWAAPLEAIQCLPGLPYSSVLVLHDSVMANSVEAAHCLQQSKASLGQTAVAHCLTNEERTVVVATGLGDTARLERHIDELGLQPKLMSPRDHDVVMAHSQAVFAIVCRTYRKDLEKYAKDGLLTPSGQRLLAAIEDNESRWTPTTFRAIVSNPEISSVLRAMLEPKQYKTDQ